MIKCHRMILSKIHFFEKICYILICSKTLIHVRVFICVCVDTFKVGLSPSKNIVQNI